MQTSEETIKRMSKFFKKPNITRDFVRAVMKTYNPEPSKSSGRKPVILDNTPIKKLLESYNNLTEMIEDYPAIDDIFVGVCRLELHNNTFDLSTRTLFSLLSECDFIDTKTIEYVCEVKERQARYILSACRISHRMLSNYFKLSY